MIVRCALSAITYHSKDSLQTDGCKIRRKAFRKGVVFRLFDVIIEYA